MKGKMVIFTTILKGDHFDLCFLISGLLLGKKL